MRVLVSAEPDDDVGVELLGQVDGLDVVTYDPSVGTLAPDQRLAEILIPPYRSTRRALRLLEQLPHLVMVQLLSAGADRWTAAVPDAVTLATARGAHAGPVSEWVLSAVLCQHRRWPEVLAYQRERTWAHRRFDAASLAGQRALIIGAGHIGTAVADKLAVFGTASTLVASTARDGVHGPDEILGLLPQHDQVVLTTPLTAETSGLVNAAFLAAMPTGALLVNAARGPIIDTDALVAELQTGRLRAALDVTDPEPLPRDHPLWTCPGVIISPHSARTVPGTSKLCYTVAAAQIGALLAGDVPSNIAPARRAT